MNSGIFEPGLEITNSSRENGVIKTLEINHHNIPLTGDCDLESNKEVTIPVDEYEGPVEIEPSTGKDGMEKVTVTLTDIPEPSDLESNKAATIDVSTYTAPVEITPTEGRDGMEKVTVTLDNIPSGSDLEANKAATIDVSQYSSPVEITPTAGKDGMEKATVTLTNIPAGGSATAYAWINSVTNSPIWYSFSESPENLASFLDEKYITFGVSGSTVSSAAVTSTSSGMVPDTLTKIDANSFSISNGGNSLTFTRDSTKDFTLW